VWKPADGGLEAVRCVAYLSFRLCLAHVDVPIRLYRVVFLLILQSTRVDVPIQPAELFFSCVLCCLLLPNLSSSSF
jgi:hypothetical protein